MLAPTTSVRMDSYAEMHVHKSPITNRKSNHGNHGILGNPGVLIGCIALTDQEIEEIWDSSQTARPSRSSRSSSCGTAASAVLARVEAGGPPFP